MLHAHRNHPPSLSPKQGTPLLPTRHTIIAIMLNLIGQRGTLRFASKHGIFSNASQQAIRQGLVSSYQQHASAHPFFIPMPQRYGDFLYPPNNQQLFSLPPLSNFHQSASEVSLVPHASCCNVRHSRPFAQCSLPQYLALPVSVSSASCLSIQHFLPLCLALSVPVSGASCPCVPALLRQVPGSVCCDSIATTPSSPPANKKSPPAFSAEGIPLIKTAATYSPTGVQYHRRGRA